jgi:transcription antitermination factor NusG
MKTTKARSKAGKRKARRAQAERARAAKARAAPRPAAVTARAAVPPPGWADARREWWAFAATPAGRRAYLHRERGCVVALADTPAVLRDKTVAEAELAVLGFRVWRPQDVETRLLRGRTVTRFRELLPGYVLACGSEHMAAAALSSTTCRGLLPALVEGGPMLAARIPGAVIARLIERQRAAEPPAPKRGPQPGDGVLIAVGPFAEFAARIEAILPGGRAKLLTTLFGREQALDMGLDEIRAA